MFKKTIMEGEQTFKLYHFYSKCLLLCFVFLTGCGGGGGYSSGGGGMISSGCPGGVISNAGLAAPIGVSAISGPATGDVTVSWTTVAGVTYNVYMAAAPGVTKNNWCTLSGGMMHPNVPDPFVHTMLTTGVKYYFVVTAVNIYGESPDSAQVSAVAM